MPKGIGYGKDVLRKFDNRKKKKVRHKNSIRSILEGNSSIVRKVAKRRGIK